MVCRALVHNEHHKTRNTWYSGIMEHRWYIDSMYVVRTY